MAVGYRQYELMLPDITTCREQDWRLINYRRVSSLCAAEYLHDLYNRHVPEINSIRFRNTVVLYREGAAWAFAPAEEWACLAEWFGGRLASERCHRELRAIEAHIERPHELTTVVVTKLASTNLAGCSGRELAELLLDLHYLTLGDIYAVNLVQIEHALTEAVRASVSALVRPDVADVAVAECIGPLTVTVARTEETAFLDLVKWGRDHGCVRINAHEPDSDSAEAEIRRRITAHLEVWGGVFGAYGTTLPDPQTLHARYHEASEALARNAPTLGDDAGNRARVTETRWRDALPPDIRAKVDLLRQVGELRDRNKALLGKVMVWRDRLIAEIGRRADLGSEALSLHSLRELCGLAIGEMPLSPDRLKARSKGVMLKREEGIITGINAAWSLRTSVRSEKVLTGRCASRGSCTGSVRIVSSNHDALSVVRGEVMVAPGTDFDVMVGMQRAGAIVTEEGGLLSHAAVIAREYGVPCVIGVADATTALANGERVRVDADRGTVTVIE